ncbi:MAG: phosphotransferase [Candidatus Neomarinimicrobiota bacterium]|nr:phosphotransferase [Candidatus Neomarinimicrobiota bacterium]
MYSVFNEPPPKISKQKAVAFIQQHYGIRCTAEDLYSERDQNFYIISENGCEYVLKVSNPAEDQSALQMQIDCTEYISDKDKDLNIPLTIKSTSGEDIITLDRDGSTYYARMVTFVSGIFLKDYAQSEDMLFNLGAFMARLSRAMKGFEHPAANRKFAWNLSQDDFIQHFSQELKDDEERDIVRFFLHQTRAYHMDHGKDLPWAVIHNDGNDHNILVNDLGKTTGIIDFGDMGYSYRAAEPAVAMAYVAIGAGDPLHCIGQVLKGYHESFQFSEKELKFAIYLVCLRLSISVTMAAYRKKLFPQNEYITVSEAPAWEFLRRMRHQNLDQFSEDLYDLAR